MRVLKWEGSHSRSIHSIHSLYLFISVVRFVCLQWDRKCDQNDVPIFASEISVAWKSTDDSMGIENRCIGGTARVKERREWMKCKALVNWTRWYIIESRSEVWHYNISMLRWLWSLTTINNIHTIKCFFRYINCFVISFFFCKKIFASTSECVPVNGIFFPSDTKLQNRINEHENGS